MEFTVESKNAVAALAKKTSGLAIAFFERELKKNAVFKKLDAKLGGELKKALKNKEFEAKKGQALLLSTLGRLPARKLFIAGLGEEKEFELDDARKFSGSAANAFKTSACTEFAVVLPEPKKANAFETARALSEGVLLANYEFDKYKHGEEQKKKHEIKKIIVFTRDAAAARKGIAFGRIIAEATNAARSITNEPANVATPDFVARKLKELASRARLHCKILDEKQLRKQGFNALLSVARGSAQPPRLVIVEYRGGGKRGETIALVGKGVTFDAGGISLKPAQDMDKMKFDKSGACAVIGVARAAKELDLPINVIALAPLVENVPSGSSYKPGDVVSGISGKSIEVLNTDAEGRIVLSDVLSYAVKKFKPKTLIDVATLTGSCIIALGDGASGMLSNDDELAQALYAAGQASGDRVWRLPLWDEYAEKIKSDVADVKNTGDGTAGTITGALFLKNLIELEKAKEKKAGKTKESEKKVKWAHLDIAGTAWTTKQKPYLSLGATGAGVRVITEYLFKKYGKNREIKRFLTPASKTINE